MTVNLGILGAAGRMGQEIASLGKDNPAFQIKAVVDRPDHPLLGQAIQPGLILSSDPAALAAQCDVLIDFSSPQALSQHLQIAMDHHCAMVIGVTGIDDDQQAAIVKAAETIPILRASNTSLGVALLDMLVTQAAKLLPPEWDVEILEMHHRDKVDAPSGTALSLGQAAAQGRGVDLDRCAVTDRAESCEKRKTGSIGFASLRGGSVPGDHKVIFAGDNERLELSHYAQSRSIFAKGALRAAQWIFDKSPGLYGMQECLTTGP